MGKFSYRVHRKKRFASFPSTAGMSLPKLSLGGNNDVITELFLPRGSLVSDIPAGDGKLENLFLRCMKLSNARIYRPSVRESKPKIGSINSGTSLIENRLEQTLRAESVLLTFTRKWFHRKFFAFSAAIQYILYLH
jgi:hypothetical protein